MLLGSLYSARLRFAVHGPCLRETLFAKRIGDDDDIKHKLNLKFNLISLIRE